MKQSEIFVHMFGPHSTCCNAHFENHIAHSAREHCKSDMLLLMTSDLCQPWHLSCRTLKLANQLVHSALRTAFRQAGYCRKCCFLKGFDRGNPDIKRPAFGDLFVFFFFVFLKQWLCRKTIVVLSESNKVKLQCCDSLSHTTALN